MAAGDAAAALAGGAARASRALQHELDPPGLPRAAGRPRRGSSPRASSSSAASTQGAFSTRQQLADLLGLPLDRVRVRPAPLGGAFGGKLMISEPLAAAAALRLGRPVRLALTRIEDFAAVQPGARPS